MKRKEYLLDRLEELRFKHRLLDNWVAEIKYDEAKMKAKKIEKLKMKEEIVNIEQELKAL